MNEITVNKLYNGDALELLKKLKDESVDFTLLDPDYQDWDTLCENGLIEEAIRVTKKTGNIICFTKQPFDFKLRNVVHPNFRREIIWAFNNGGAWVSNQLPLVSHQKLFWLTKGKKHYFNPRTGLPYQEGTKNMKRPTKGWLNYEAEGREFVKSEEGTWMRDHYQFPKPHTGEIPSKPSDLINILVRCLCPDGGLVLDPFFGSGVTADACIEQNKDFIGFEIDPTRVESFNTRMSLPPITVKKQPVRRKVKN